MSIAEHERHKTNKPTLVAVAVMIGSEKKKRKHHPRLMIPQWYIAHSGTLGSHKIKVLGFKPSGGVQVILLDLHAGGPFCQ